MADMPEEKPVPVVEAPAAAPAPAPAPEAPALDAPAPAAPEAPAPAPEVPAEKPPEAAAPAAAPDLLKDATVEEAPKDGEKPTEKPAEEKPAPEAKAPEEKPTEKPPEEKKADGEKPAEPAAEEKPALEPVEYKFEVPEQITLDDTMRTSFVEAMDAARVGDGQKLMDLHTTAMQLHHDRLQQDQRDSWSKTLENWRTDTMADEQVGGAAWETVRTRGARVRDMFVSRHKQGSDEYKTEMADFNHMLDSTGAGNHRAMWRFLDNLADRILERGAPIFTDPKPAPQSKKGSEAMYTHERSPGNGRA